ncbi:MAG TPA: carbamoyltransferase HypF [Chthoniobacteraceae bacterium]|jgi:hydrogenase maturation protein HypF|nr:carbamoyltransferase HypF [Chthoniobacteraceae bacterium]
MNASRTERARVIVRGAVQGVGFRPFVYRNATEMNLNGWVSNSAQGVFIDVEGTHDTLEAFVQRLEAEKPPRAVIQSIECSYLEASGYERFEIRESDDAGGKSVLILPDIATCPDCLREISDPRNRRHRYPFTNCTNCGPRFSIIQALPYDRANTTMKHFTMCAACEREYQDPLDRRFHAQPNACPVCGPQLEWWDASGSVLSRRDEALLAAAQALREGKIIALKGVGGFQLMVDARSEAAVKRLRKQKRREEKPFALMMPSLAAVREACEVSAAEERLLVSPECPIVLLRARKAQVAAPVAPGNPYLGVMLPYSPLHHLLMAELGFPVVATSGNLSDEPICTDEREAVERLRGIADIFLVHNRPIERHMDDSIARIVCGGEQILRRARGYAPLPIHVDEPLPAILAVGAHVKTSIALSAGTEIFVSQHIGDLETAPAHTAFRKTAADLPRLYDAAPEAVACDLHPDYLSTQFAMQYPARVIPVQHHYAHVLACMAENDLRPPVLGISWDGTGFASGGAVWGGEFLLVNGEGFERVGYFREFRLPGGEAAVKEPRRCALGVLFEIFGEELWDRDDLLRNFSKREIRPLRQMLERNINSPLTSSAGRLFDAVAALSGLRRHCSFEGQAAMELEFAVDPEITDAYPFAITGPVVDWQPMILEILHDLMLNADIRFISSRFHHTLSRIIVAMAQKIGTPSVALTGGCFQNRILTERAASQLGAAGFQPHWHQRVPPNDGGIALGQILGAARQMKNYVSRDSR